MGHTNLAMTGLYTGKVIGAEAAFFTKFKSWLRVVCTFSYHWNVKRSLAQSNC